MQGAGGSGTCVNPAGHFTQDGMRSPPARVTAAVGAVGRTNLTCGRAGPKTSATVSAQPSAARRREGGGHNETQTRLKGDSQRAGARTRVAQAVGQDNGGSGRPRHRHEHRHGLRTGAGHDQRVALHGLGKVLGNTTGRTNL